MNAIVTDALAADLITLERVVDAPTGPLGYGTDLSCVSDITEALDEVDAGSTLGIAQAVLRRLSTPRGGLVDDPDYGLDVRGMLNRATDAAAIRDLQGQVRNEVSKDDRVDAVDAVVSVTFAPTTLRVALTITPADVELDPFTMTVAVTSTAVLLEALS
jgi:phage baseplate assembly protein W